MSEVSPQAASLERRKGHGPYTHGETTYLWDFDPLWEVGQYDNPHDREAFFDGYNDCRRWWGEDDGCETSPDD